MKRNTLVKTDSVTVEVNSDSCRTGPGGPVTITPNVAATGPGGLFKFRIFSLS